MYYTKPLSQNLPIFWDKISFLRYNLIKMNNFEIIESKITRFPAGKVFVVSDFTDQADYENARKILMRLEDKGAIRRILPGIYDKPLYSKILDQEVSPDINAVAEAIARKNNWTITPSGNTALNLLGLDTQVPARWEYLSSGDTKSYQIGNATINFTHRADKELNGMSKKTALVIQAIKALGNENITENIISKLKGRLSDAEKAQILTEARPTTAWIYEIIKRIAKD